MTNTTYSTYIRSFDFAQAKFESLPKEIFQTDRKTLSVENRAILDAIKFQMTVSKYNNMMQKVKYSNILRTISTGISFAVVGFFLLSLTYYANINFHLGMTFLTEFFA